MRNGRGVLVNFQLSSKCLSRVTFEFYRLVDTIETIASNCRCGMYT